MLDKTKKDIPLDTPEDLDDFMADEPVDEEEPGEAFEGDEEHRVPMEEEEMDIPGGESERSMKEDDMLDIAADVPLQVVAVMGKRNMTLKEIASLRMGEVIELGRPANEVVDLVAGGKLIAKGELVEIEGKLGVRIVKMMR